jgi:hypothetical protein
MKAASHITTYRDLEQGSDAWLEARRGMLTASEMKLILTPTLKQAANKEERVHLCELAAQRITKFVEPHYVSEDMLRGQIEEDEARREYATHYASVERVGFIVNRRWGFPIGCSPDGLVGLDGGIEVKSRRQKFQFQTLTEHVPNGTIPEEYVLQLQTCLLVAERQWWDFISYCGGLPMAVIRVWPDDAIQTAIVEAAAAAEERIAARVAKYHAVQEIGARLIPTERIQYEDMTP